MIVKIKKRLAKLFFVFFMSVTLIATPTTALGDYWGSNYISEFWRYIMDLINEKRHAIIMGILKNVAVNTISEFVQEMLNEGAIGEEMWIVDWEKTLFNEPLAEAELWMNDYFSAVMPSSSSSNYTSAWNDATYGTDNYVNYLRNQAEQLTIYKDYEQITSEDYTTIPSEMFSNFNFKAFTTYAEENVAKITSEAQRAYSAKIIQEVEEATSKALAYEGYKGNETEDGMVSEPGTSARDVKQSMIDLPSKIIGGAENETEVITSLVVSIVQSVLSGSSSGGSSGGFSLDNISILNENGFSDYTDGSDWIQDF